jgi:hypothetical protein
LTGREQELGNLCDEVVFVEHGVVIRRKKRKRAQGSFVSLGSCGLGLFRFCRSDGGALWDSLLIMGNVKGGPPPEKIVTLIGLIAPKLVRYSPKFVCLSIGVARLPGARGAIGECTLVVFRVWSDLTDWQP